MLGSRMSRVNYIDVIPNTRAKRAGVRDHTKCEGSASARKGRAGQVLSASVMKYDYDAS